MMTVTIISDPRTPWACLPSTAIEQTPIESLRTMNLVRHTICSCDSPVFPLTQLNISSGTLAINLRLILPNSAIPPLCMN